MPCEYSTPSSIRINGRTESRCYLARATSLYASIKGLMPVPAAALSQKLAEASPVMGRSIEIGRADKGPLLVGFEHGTVHAYRPEQGRARPRQRLNRVADRVLPQPRQHHRRAARIG